jgi:5-formyltetrahydrofolate cyclo-ligase
MPANEIQTSAIVKHALAAGKTVFVPYLCSKPALEKGLGANQSRGPRRLMDMVRLRDLQDLEHMSRDAWGIPTFEEESVHERESLLGHVGRKTAGKDIDIVFVPGVAFEMSVAREGVKRIGHGMGFYDRFFQEYCEGYRSITPKLYGLALMEQVLEDSSSEMIPVGRDDKLLDGVIVGDGRIVEV